MSNEYQFITRWRLRATADEVAGVLRDPRDLTQWWPSVYLDVQVIDDGDIEGVGRVVDLWTKGWLPYTLRWRFTTIRNDGAGGISLRADGDFIGGGGGVDLRPGWRRREGVLRLADSRGETLASPADVADAAGLQRKSSMGDAQRRGKHAARSIAAALAGRGRRECAPTTGADVCSADPYPPITEV